MLLQMGNATYFCVLTLYPITLVNTLISSNNYFVESLGFSTRKIISSANRDNFTSSFPTCMPFISFSCPTALARTFNSMLNISGESGHPCLVLKQLFTVEYDVSYGPVVCGLHYVEVHSVYTHFVESFYHKWMLNFTKSFFFIY